MINTIIIRGALHMFNLLNVTMSQCHDASGKCYTGRRCLPRIKGMPSTGHGRHLHIGMQGIGTTHTRHRNTSKRPATPV